MYLKLFKGGKKLYTPLATALLFLQLLSMEGIYAQQKAVSPISIQINQASITDVFNSIKKQSNYTVIYSDQVTALSKKVDLNINAKDIQTVLDYLSKQYGITYQITGNTISVKLTEVKAQKIRGNVKDRQGLGVPGASIILKGTNHGVSTDLDGNFELDAVIGKDRLETSFIGYKTVETLAHSFMKIVMDEDQTSLDEIVVIGYGTQKRSDLTGAVSTVKSKDLTSYTVTDPIQALQGKVAGVSVSQNTGEPSGDFSIRIRGINSIMGGNSPLIIVDGIPQSSSTIGSYDIESMEILKDASATAIYGSRGANGVVLITTKRGKEGSAIVDYNYDYGSQRQIKKLDLMNEREWASFYNEYLVNSKILEKAPFSEEDLQKMGKGTDWQNLMFKPAPIQSHSLSISGSMNKLRYYVSGTMLNRSGIVPNSSFDKKNVRSSLDIPVKEWLDMSLQVGYTTLIGFNQSQGGGAAGSSLMSAIYAASPHFYPYEEDGSYKELRTWFPWSSHELRNPLNIVNESWYKTDNRLTNVNTSFLLKPLEGLTFKSIFGFENSDSRYESYLTENYLYSNNAAVLNARRGETYINENILNYNFNLNDLHRFDLMVAYTNQRYQSKLLEASGNTFLSDIAEVYDLGAAEIMNSPKSGFTKWVLQSYLARLNYSYNDKYYLTASIRADGSSRYSKGNQWGYFPSVALAWRVSNEEFLSEFLKRIAINDLKIRTSYGLTGSTAINPYATQNILQTGKTATGNGNYSYYAPGTVFPGDLKWETTKQWDFGLDVGLLNNRFTLTVDIYKKMTEDMLNRVFLPSSSGYKNTIRNIGSMSNKGVEITLGGSVVSTKDFEFSTQVNFSRNVNKIEKLANGDDLFGSTHTGYAAGTITILREGEALGSFYLYKDAGLDQDGKLSYVDINGDGAYTDKEDRYLAGSPFPDFTYGITTNFRYKDFELDMFWQGSKGNKVFNLSEMRNYSYSQGMNIEKSVYYNSWREGQDNSNALYPRIERVGTLRYSDRFLEDGSYFRLKNIALTYNLPVHKMAKKLFTKLSFYVSAQNILTFTKYSGVDPEVNSKKSDIDNAIDHFTYPNTKTISFGIKAQF
ncbi:TonB-dependent receptor [Myroides odoratimimus]|uniref:TonB-dependent receptor n=1 Tax=Myroides odoratimimus TaxID=76832 RepID=UPI00257836DB|nr:TonB-dependent receptor [Myroides odoratimimus]MDM1060694.1 TonB-dependent receptor [Myroides odoratimimus]